MSVKPFVIIAMMLAVLGSGADGHMHIINKNVDSWFDEYGQIDWTEEQARLSNFAYFLNSEKDFIGYIGFNWSSEIEELEMKCRANRAVDYLVRKRKIARDRLVVVNGGRREYVRTILQPVAKTAPVPDFR